MEKLLLIITSLLIGGYFLYNRLWLNPNSHLINIYTEWGEKIDKNNILQEYPRPQYQRESYLNLNGIWKYALLNKDQEEKIPIKKYDGEILVPFSIEAPLSGVQKSLKPGMTLWYNRKINLTSIENKGRYILHFGAVDQEADVYINNNFVGNHKGGYCSFNFDITNEIIKVKDISEIDLSVRVVDNFKNNGEAYGKQSNPRGNIWYISTGGIWQTVWIESVPDNYLKNVRITPLYDEKKVEFIPEYISSDDNKKNAPAKYIITDKEGKTIEGEFDPTQEKTVVNFNYEKIYNWSPEKPNLYNITFIYGEDIIYSYFAMRKYSIGADNKGIKRLFLNNKPYFHIGVLDQGYWSDGYYTAPSDEALKDDIIKMKQFGFNMLRKHIKIEPMRWYYHCDTLGMIVWQDMISGGSPYSPIVIQITPFLSISLPDSWYSIFGRRSEESRQTYYRELKEMIIQLYNVPSISTWVPFNEGWGQFDALKAVDFIKEIDTTRYIDHASGFHDQYGGDFNSLHIYLSNIDIKPDKYGRVTVLSEFGGFSYVIEGHCGTDNHYGYSMYKSEEELFEAYNNIILKQVIPAISKGLSAIVYTQLSDVEDEVNGFITYDRKVVKMDCNKVRQLNDLIQFLD